MTGLPEVLVIWAVVSALIVIWLADAAALVQARAGRPDATECACCRHDELTHRHERSGTGCTQCPCEGFRTGRRSVR